MKILKCLDIIANYPLAMEQQELNPKIISVELRLRENDSRDLYEVVNNVVGKNYFFYSNNFSWIQGNVCLNSHLTLCYGIIDRGGKEKEISKVLNTLNLNKAVKISKIGYMKGYRGQYYCIYIIPDLYESVYKIVNELRETSELIPESKPFLPHISLCYIKSEASIYEIIENLSIYLLEKELKFKEFRLV